MCCPLSRLLNFHREENKMFRPTRSRVPAVVACLFVLFLFLVIDSSVSHAGEIYGQVTLGKKAHSKAKITFQCGSYKKTVSTNKKGRYRLRPGPSGEVKCKVSVSGAKGRVTIYSSKGRTRANLAVVNGSLRKK